MKDEKFSNRVDHFERTPAASVIEDVEDAGFRELINALPEDKFKLLDHRLSREGMAWSFFNVIDRKDPSYQEAQGLLQALIEAEEGFVQDEIDKLIELLAD